MMKIISESELHLSLLQVKLLVLDVDGVLTNGMPKLSKKKGVKG